MHKWLTPRFIILAFLIALLALGPVAQPAQAVTVSIPVFLFEWGTSGMDSQQFLSPYGVELGQDGENTRVFVADTENNRIQVFTTTGVYVKTMGEGQLNAPRGLAVDAGGNIYVADTNAHRVVKILPDGTLQVLAGGYGSAFDPATNTVQFNRPADIAIDAGNSWLYVADSYNHRVVRLDLTGKPLAAWGGPTYGSDSTHFYAPSGVAVDTDGNVYVADTLNNRVVKITAGGERVQWGGPTAGAGNGQYKQPRGVAVAKNTYTGESIVYVADTGNQRIQKLTSNGAFQYKWGMAGSSPSQFTSPYAVTAESEDSVFVADSGNDRIQAFEPNYAPDSLSIDPGSVLESQKVGIRVGDFIGHDANSGDKLSYALVDIAGQDCTGNDSFTVAGITLYAAASFDYESKNSFTICARVTDSTGAYYETPLTIAILNGSDAPIFDDTAFTIPESTTAVPNLNGIVGTMTAFDNDAGEDLTFTIESGPYSDAFAVEKLDATSAKLKVTSDLAKAALLDYETAPNQQVTIVVRATDLIGLSDTATITVTLSPVNDPPVVTIPAEPFSIAENSPRYTVVGTISITDVDTPISSLTVSDNNSAFTADTAGTIKVYGSLDFETKQSHSYIVTVKDGTNTVNSDPITINVTDIDEPPTIPTSFTVDENTPVGTVLNIATDPEKQPITYQMVTDESNGVFAVNSSGQVIVNKTQDYDTLVTKYFYITLKAKDTTHDFGTQVRVKMYIGDVNELPVFSPAQLSVRENTVAGAIVGDITATDPEKARVYFRITSTDSPFSITSSTVAPWKGTVQVTNPAALDHEKLPTYDMVVEADEDSKFGSPATQTFTVNIVNVNEPIKVDNQTFTTSDRSSVGTVIGQIAYQDPDAETHPTFSVTGGDGGANFSVNTTTGDVTVKNNEGLDFYDKPTYTLNVLVSDNGIPNSSDPAISVYPTMTIQLTPGNDPPIFADATFTLLENSPAGTEVGTVYATDPEGTTVTYGIEGTTGTFAVDPSSGLVTVADPTLLDYETASNNTIELVIRASDSGDTVMSDTYTYPVILINQNEAPTISDQSITVRENSADGSQVGTVSAKDPDGDGMYYEVTGGTGKDVFAVSTTTGKITVKSEASGMIKYTNSPLTLTVRVRDTGQLYSEPATVTLNIEPLADLAVSSISALDTVLTGSANPYTIKITNEGAGSSSAYILEVFFPNQVRFIATGSTPGCAQSGAKVICNRTGLASGASEDIIVNGYVAIGTPDNTWLTTHASILTDSNDLSADNNDNSMDHLAVSNITVANDTFNQEIPPGWSPSIQGTVPNPNSGEGFMGEYGAETATFRREVPPHSNVELGFDLYIIRSWDGLGGPGPDIWRLIVGDLQSQGGTLLNLVNTTFSNWIDDPLHLQSFPNDYQEGTNPGRTGALPERVLGFTGSNTQVKDSVYRFHFIFPHKDLALILNFIGEGLEDKTDESWGIDNLKIVISGDKNFYQYIPMLTK